MTSSRSRASTSRAAVVLCLLLVGIAGSAEAGRKRLVVLEFDGPKAAAFQGDVVSLLKKSNTVLAASKWTDAADAADASDLTDKNIKKVAAKLKVDGVLEGKIEKRRDSYIVKLKLHGKNGDVVATVNTKADSGHLEGSAMKDVKDELVPQVEALAPNKGAVKEDDAEDTGDEAPKTHKKKKPVDDSDDGAAPVDEEAGSTKSGFGHKKKKVADDGGDDVDPPKEKAKTHAKHDDDSDTPLPKSHAKKKKASDDEAVADDDDGGAKKKKKKAKKKKVAVDDDGNAVEASSDDGGGDDTDDGDAAAKLSPANRALDLVIGASFTARRMSFTYSSDLAVPPPQYKGVPVGGFLLDATVYPADWKHTRKDIWKNVGFQILVDKVVKISSKVEVGGMTATLPTSEGHYAFGPVFRYPIGSGAMAPVIGASLKYGRQSFDITVPTGIDPATIPPNTDYSMVDPTVFFKYPAMDKLNLSASLGYVAVLKKGPITSADNYGNASASGFEGEISGDYALTKNLFARAAFRFETIGYKFSGGGAMATGRDSDPEQDVFGARDTYIGGAITVGATY